MLSPAQYNLLFPWRSANGISSTNKEYPIPQTPQFEPLTFNIVARNKTDKSRGGTWRFANLLFSCFSHQASERRPAQH